MAFGLANRFGDLSKRCSIGKRKLTTLAGEEPYRRIIHLCRYINIEG